MEKVEIVGIHIDNITMDEGRDRLEGFLEQNGCHMVFTPNSEMLVDAVKDIELGDILNAGHLVIPDGIGVVIASKFYHTPLKEKVAGVELMGRLIELAHQKNKTIYLLGGADGVAKEADLKLREAYEGLEIVGTRNGYFSDEEECEVIEEINGKKADILFVGLGSPKQEQFIYRNCEKLNTRIAMGVGGSIDIFAGRAQRAPELYQKLGLEWFYRLVKQPSRFKRILKLPKFIVLAFYDSKLRG